MLMEWLEKEASDGIAKTAAAQFEEELSALDAPSIAKIWRQTKEAQDNEEARYKGALTGGAIGGGLFGLARGAAYANMDPKYRALLALSPLVGAGMGAVGGHVYESDWGKRHPVGRYVAPAVLGGLGGLGGAAIGARVAGGKEKEKKDKEKTSAYELLQPTLDPATGAKQGLIGGGIIGGLYGGAMGGLSTSRPEGALLGAGLGALGGGALGAGAGALGGAFEREKYKTNLETMKKIREQMLAEEMLKRQAIAQGAVPVQEKTSSLKTPMLRRVGKRVEDATLTPAASIMGVLAKKLADRRAKREAAKALTKGAEERKVDPKMLAGAAAGLGAAGGAAYLGRKAIMKRRAEAAAKAARKAKVVRIAKKTGKGVAAMGGLAAAGVAANRLIRSRRFRSRVNPGSMTNKQLNERIADIRSRVQNRAPFGPAGSGRVR